MTATTNVKPTVSEFDRRTIGQTFDLLAAALDDASILDDIPNGCALFLLPQDDEEFIERSIELGMTAIRQGRNVYFKHVPAGFGKDEATDTSDASAGQ